MTDPTPAEPLPAPTSSRVANPAEAPPTDSPTVDDPVLYYIDAARQIAAAARDEMLAQSIDAAFASELSGRAPSTETIERLRQRLTDLFGPGHDDHVFFLMTSVGLDSEDEIAPLYERLANDDRSPLQQLLRRLRGRYGPEYRTASRSSNELPEDWVRATGIPSVRWLVAGPQFVYELKVARADGEEYLLRFRDDSLLKFLEYVVSILNTALPQAAGLLSYDDVAAFIEAASQFAQAFSGDESDDGSGHGSDDGPHDGPDDDSDAEIADAPQGAADPA